MSALRDKYQSVSQFFKDVKRVIEDIVTRLSDVETRIDEGVGGGALPQEEEEPVVQETVDPFQYEGPFAVMSYTEGYAPENTGSTTTFIGTGGVTSSPGDVHYIGCVISGGAINDGQRRIPVSGFGHPPVSSSGGTSARYYMIPDDYSLYLKIPARSRGTDVYDTEAYHESILDTYLTSGGTMSFPHIVAPIVSNPALFPLSSGEQPYEYIMLAQNRGGKLIQAQFGEVTDLPQYHTPLLASSAYRAGYASWAGYRGPFYVERVGSMSYSSGDFTGYVNIYDNTNFYARGAEVTSINIPYAGHIVQGGSHTVVDGGFMVPVPYKYDQYIGGYAPANIYLYKDENTSTFKFSAIASGEIENPFTGFYTRLALSDMGAIVQTQFGDIVDVDSGGSTNIYSSSIYSSTYIDSRTFVTSTTVDRRSYTTSTYVDSRSYSSTIIMSGGMSYNGAFKVDGGIDSSVTSNPFICSCIDGQGRANNVAGYVIAGNVRTPVAEPEVFEMIDGARVYLVGTPNLTNHTATYSIVCEPTGAAPSITGNQWYTQLAYKSGGQILQNQFGDVVAPYEIPAASNGGVQQIISGDNVYISPEDGKGIVTINASSGGGGGIVSSSMIYPRYANLADNNPYAGSMTEGVVYTVQSAGWLRFTCMGTSRVDACEFLHINGNAIGMYKGGGGGFTTFLPLEAGATVYYTGGVECKVMFDGGYTGGTSSTN